jgi:hypothetical protein
MNRFEGRQPNRIHNGGLAHFGATIVFWLAAGAGIGKDESTAQKAESKV